ncbi:hypothetical protein RDI58_019600 [Solanum bulbocastanum]|uniref:Uncharacterized protein n=1 Tax=Solanum bulbocastanum TaxID=147425 RepID=A0AAN8T8F8_SOLBU
MIDILQRLGMIEILESAQRVCSTWWKVSHDPTMWRAIDLKYVPDVDSMFYVMCSRVLVKICWIVVSSQLRYLRLVKCNIVARSLTLAAKNFPLLEELHTHLTLITKEDIESVGRYCPLLKSFTLNASECIVLGDSLSPDDGQALAIARSMPELRHLSLILNALTNVGLQAILVGCPQLVSLDLRHCNIDLERDIGRRCRQQIVDLKQPHASCQYYEFDSEVCYYIYYWSSYDYDQDHDDGDMVTYSCWK